MKRFLFIKNAAILTITALFLRSVGMVFRVYLSDRLGAEGMGLYQLIFSLYTLFAAFATGGVSIAVTRLCAIELSKNNSRGVKKILLVASATALTLGLLSGAALFLFADPLSALFLKDPRAVFSLQVLAPSLPVISLAAVLRGYFIARRKVSLPSISQIVEQIVRMAVIFFLLERAAATADTAIACGIVFIGSTISEVASFLYLRLGAWRDKRRLPKTEGKSIPVLAPLLTVCVPIALSGYLTSFLRTVENLMVPEFLTRYTHSKELSLSQFGMLKGMALPLIFFPSSFLSALSTLLVPEVTEASALNQQGKLARTIGRALRITLCASMLIGGLFTLFSDQIGNILYKSSEVGNMLLVLGPLTPFMYLESIVDGILKGLGQQVHSLFYSVLDSAVRISLIFLLLPGFGMKGFLFLMIISNLLTSLLNLRRLLIVAPVKFRFFRWIVLPLTCFVSSSFLYLTLARVLPLSLPLLWQTVLGGALVCVLYVLLLFLSGGLSRSDFAFFHPSKM